jgi:HAD superfamily hydrolase (TIGR01549 family)
MMKRPVRAVLLDIDGTLYHQSTLRCLMALELCTLPLAMMSCKSAYTAWRILGYFRRVREELRGLYEPESCLATLQYVEAAKQAGENPMTMEGVVSEWIYQRPLKYLKLCRRRGIEAFLAYLESKGIQIGVFSDYPAWEKLSALGLGDKVSLALCATDSDVNAFKPHPKGFLRACAIWGLHPEEVLYVGDRPEVDALGAAAAGMSCVILTRGPRLKGQGNSSSAYVTFSSFERLQHALTADS